MHYNRLFQDRDLKIFSGSGTALPQTPPHPLGASIVAPSALHTSGFWRSVICVPYFQCRLLATLTVTNVVQGKRSQWWTFTGPPNQKSWLRQWWKSGFLYVYIIQLQLILHKVHNFTSHHKVSHCLVRFKRLRLVVNSVKFWSIFMFSLFMLTGITNTCISNISAIRQYTTVLFEAC